MKQNLMTTIVFISLFQPLVSISSDNSIVMDDLQMYEIVVDAYDFDVSTDGQTSFSVRFDLETIDGTIMSLTENSVENVVGAKTLIIKSIKSTRTGTFNYEYRIDLEGDDGCRELIEIVSGSGYSFTVKADFIPVLEIPNASGSVVNGGAVCDVEGEPYPEMEGTDGFSSYSWQCSTDQSSWTTSSETGSTLDLKISDFSGLQYGDNVFFKHKVNGGDYSAETTSTAFRFYPDVPKVTDYSKTDVQCYGEAEGSILIQGSSQTSRVHLDGESFFYYLYKEKPDFSDPDNYNTVVSEDMVKTTGINDVVVFDNLTAGDYWVFIYPELKVDDVNVTSGCGDAYFEKIAIGGPATPIGDVTADASETLSCDTSVSLTGSALDTDDSDNTTTSGSWTLESGSGTIDDPTNPNTDITGLGLGTNTFRWTVTQNYGCVDYREVSVEYFNVSSPDAGDDFTTCANEVDLTEVAKDDPETSESEKWYFLNGTEYDEIDDPTQVTLGDDENTFKLEYYYGHCTEEDEVIITKHVLSQANAGSDALICGVSGQLSGNQPASGESGTWTKVSGPAISFTNPDLYNTAITGLQAGETYELRWTLSVNDAVSCSTTSDEVTLRISDLSMDGMSAVDVSCFGEKTGTITVTASSSAGGLEYSLTGADYQDSNQFNELLAGTHRVYVRDSDGCVLSDDVVVDQPENPLDVGTTEIHVSCNGANDASLEVNASGGTAPYSYSISGQGSAGPQSSQTFTGLSPGDYTATVTDAEGCTASATTKISEPDVLKIETLSTTDLSCNGANDGSLTVNISGGTADYTYELSGQASISTTKSGLSHTFSSLEPDTYAIKITDANGCEIEDSDLVIGEPDLVAFTISEITHVKCFGASTGSIRVAANGGTSKYEYKIYRKDGGAYSAQHALPQANIDADVQVEFSNLIEGTYRVDVEDANSCPDQREFTITQPEDVSGTFSLTHVKCNGDATGSIEVSNVSGGVSPYEYALDEGTYQTSVSFTSLTSKTYTVHVKDANDCVYSFDQTITEPTALAFSDLTSVNVSCHSGSDGSITFQASGGTSPYQYFIREDGQPTLDQTTTGFTGIHSFSGLSANKYVLTIVDANDCTTEANLTITEPGPIVAAISAQERVSCAGLSDASLSININGGTGPYDIIWENGAGTNIVTETEVTSTSLSNIAADTYKLVIIDANGCTNGVAGGYASTYEVPDPAELILSSSSIQHVSCNGESDASVILGTTGGWMDSDYQYSKDGTNFSLSNEFAGLSAGDYTFYVRDVYAGGYCETSLDITVTEPDELEISNTVVDDARCFGSADGSIELTVQGGTTPYEISLDQVEWVAFSKLEGLTAGDYTVYLRDAKSCEKQVEATIDEPEAIVITSLGQKDTNCGLLEGEISVSVTGGTAPYSYKWKDEADQIVSTTSEAENLDVGIYMLEVTDAQACTAVYTALINGQDGPELTVVETGQVTCLDGNDGFAVIEITGDESPYSIEWLNEVEGERLAQNLDVGGYAVQVTDATGCRAFARLEIDYQRLIAIEITHQDLLCYQDRSGTVQVSAYGGDTEFTYQWSTGAVTPSIKNCLSGAYDVVIGYGEGCEIDYEVTLSEPPLLELRVDTRIDPLCYQYTNGQIAVSASGGVGEYTYLWSHDGSINPVINNLPEGMYEVTVMDANGCQTTEQITLDDPNNLVIEFVPTDPLCFEDANGSVLANVSGGTAPYEYAWNTGAETQEIADLPEGTYELIVTDAQGCQVTGSIALDDPEPLQVVLDFSRNPSCFGETNGEIQINTSGGTLPHTFSWSNGLTVEDLENLGAGTYDVLVTDANGCTAELTHELLQPDLLELSAVVSSTPSCNGDSDGGIELTVTGGTLPFSAFVTMPNGEIAEYTDKESPFVVTGLAAGAYTIEIIDQQGCVDQVIDVQMTQPDPLELILLEQEDPSCEGYSDGLIEFFPQGGTIPYVFAWNSGETSSLLVEATEGEYVLTVRDANECTYTSEEIPLADPEPVPISIADFAICTGQVVDLYPPIEGQDHLWTGPNDFEVSNRIASISEPGTYLLEMTAYDGCYTQTSFDVIIDDGILDADFLVAGEAFAGDTLILIDISWPIPDDVQWVFPDGTTIITESIDYAEILFEEPGEYIIGQTCKLAGCNASYQQVITIFERSESEEESFRFAEPEQAIIQKFRAYPNPSDGAFSIELKLRQVSSADIRIVDLKGNKIAFSQSLGGSDEYVVKLDGSGLKPGMYFIQAEVGDEQKSFRMVKK